MSHFDLLPDELLEIISFYLPYKKSSLLLREYRFRLINDIHAHIRIFREKYPKYYQIMKDLKLLDLETLTDFWLKYESNVSVTRKLLDLTYDNLGDCNLYRCEDFIMHIFFYQNFKYVYNRLRSMKVIDKLGKFRIIPINHIDSNSWNQITAQLIRLLSYKFTNKSIIKNFINEHDLEKYPSSRELFNDITVDEDEHSILFQIPFFLYLYYTDPKVERNLEPDSITSMYTSMTGVCYDLTQDKKETGLHLLDILTKDKSNLDSFKNDFRVLRKRGILQRNL